MTPVYDRSPDDLTAVPMRQWKLSELRAHSLDLRDEVALAHDPHQCMPCALLIEQLWSERRLVEEEIGRRLEIIRTRKVRD